MKMQDAKALDNFNRLRQHLKDGSLAVQRVRRIRFARYSPRSEAGRQGFRCVP